MTEKSHTTIKDEILAGLERRKKLITSKCVPFEFEIFKTHGDYLGNIIMNQMAPNSITLMHQDKNHQMPSKNLWIAPEDRVNKKVCITNASIYDKIKATSHKGILKIGEGIEKKIEKKNLLQLQNTIQENSEFERFECEKRLQFALKVQQDYYKEKINKLTEKFNEKLKYQKEMLQNHYQKKCNKIVHKVMSDCCYTIKNRLVMEKNKLITCTCIKRKRKKIRKFKKTDNQYTSCTNLQIPEISSAHAQSNSVFNTKTLCNMMHFVLCGEKLENIKLMNNIKINYASELNNLKINLFKIMENITKNIQRPPLSAFRSDKICSEPPPVNENEVICCNELFDMLCCLRQKIYNVVLCLDNRIESLNIGTQKNNILNTCNVIVPRKIVKTLFCDCVSSSLDSSTVQSNSSESFIDFASPNVEWNSAKDNAGNSLDIICQCNKKIELSCTSSSSERSVIGLECLPVENQWVRAIQDDKGSDISKSSSCS